MEQFAVVLHVTLQFMLDFLFHISEIHVFDGLFLFTVYSNKLGDFIYILYLCFKNSNHLKFCLELSAF